MKEADRQCTKICLCSNFVISENQISNVIEKAKKLFAYGQQKKEDRMLELVGMYSFEKTYKTSSFAINPWIQIMPSQTTFSAKFDEILERTHAKADAELEVVRKQYTRLIGKQKNNTHLLIGLDCEPSEHLEKLDLNALEKSSYVDRFLETIRPFVPKSIILRNCINLVYSTKDFRLTGGFPLPTKIPLPERVSSRLGEANVSGLLLSFKDSPLGISTVDISKRRDSITVFATFSSKMHMTKRILQQIYERGVQTADLFVEAIEN